MPWCPGGDHVKGTSCLHDRLLYGSSPTASVPYPTPCLTLLSFWSAQSLPLETCWPSAWPFTSQSFTQKARQGLSFLLCTPHSLLGFPGSSHVLLDAKRKAGVARDWCLTFLQMHFIPGGFKPLSIQPSHQDCAASFGVEQDNRDC